MSSTTTSGPRTAAGSGGAAGRAGPVRSPPAGASGG